MGGLLAYESQIMAKVLPVINFDWLNSIIIHT